jgi:ParB-like chromosome segregation protein Spo0J
MANQIQSIEIFRLYPHPGNPNRMSKENFRKLVRHIERSGRYEPLIVRPCSPQRPQSTQRKNKLKNSANSAYSAVKGSFQIINGHHRFEALKLLGYETCDCVVWDVDDDEANLLLATLNRLCGQDVLEKKTALLDKLNFKLKVAELARLLPQTKTQIQRLIDLHKDGLKLKLAQPDEQSIAYPFVFFLNAKQKQIVDKALSLASTDTATKAERNAQAITQIASGYIGIIEHREPEVTDGNENQVRATGAC